MSRRPTALVTGANGEIGHGLITRLAAQGRYDVLALDLKEIAPALAVHCAATKAGSIVDKALLAHIHREFKIDVIFHLAALLSTRSEHNPDEAHEVNVGGTINLLNLAVEQARTHGTPVKFFFPSSIAVYGMPDVATKKAAGAVAEDQFLEPATMYGCNKLYCEHLGRYYTKHYRRLAVDAGKPLVDFRAIRFPGLISADTMPTGGTSDYGPEMIHAAAAGKDYECFVSEDAKISFMAMPDAIDAIMALMDAPKEKLTRSAYNISAFSPSAGDFAAAVKSVFPKARIVFKPDVKRAGIVETWPEGSIDTAARKDWGFKPAYDWNRAFHDYLLPNIVKRYASA